MLCSTSSALQRPVTHCIQCVRMDQDAQILRSMQHEPVDKLDIVMSCENNFELSFVVRPHELEVKRSIVKLVTATWETLLQLLPEVASSVYLIRFAERIVGMCIIKVYSISGPADSEDVSAKGPTLISSDFSSMRLSYVFVTRISDEYLSRGTRCRTKPHQ